jgi:twitching motility protein PilT
MAGIDGILTIASERSADELTLATDQPPRASRRGSPVRLSIPETSHETLRYLLASVLSDERYAELEASGRLAVPYSAGDGTTYNVTLKLAGGALEAVFQRAAAPAPAPNAIAPAREVPRAEPRADAGPARDADAGTRALVPPPELHALLQRAVAARASDLHLYDGETPSLRVDGALRPLAERTADVARLLAGCIDDADRAALDDGRALDLALSASGLGRFRVNVYRASGRLAAAVRVLPRTAPTLAELELPIPLDELVDAPHGLVLICGATGSGKSATLAALAGEALRRRSPLIITLEDPIEYLLEPPSGSTGLVRQRQIGRDARDFPTGLRDALREDPDLLLIGEMRDPASIALALTAAETGHLVLASLHTRSAVSAIERIVDVYPPAQQQQARVQLADALRAVVSQRLLPRAGRSGRVAAVEVMRRTHNVAGLIREGKTAQLASAIQSGRKEGMLPLEACLADLVRTGQVEREHARAAANDVTSLATYLQSRFD